LAGIGVKMDAWSGKYVIGLTGNIATGKSVVRKMLEHLGAYGIDADALAHRAIARGAPGYKPVVEAFGTWILNDEKQIDRSRLAKIVFSDSHALEHLESIVHPLVRQAVALLVRRTKHKVIVLEAIKLLESPLRKNCQTIIVTYAPPEMQLARLIQKRGLKENEARQRINNQSSQEEKMLAADLLIRNEGSFEDTWHRVLAAWKSMFPEAEVPQVEMKAAADGKMSVGKARPQEASEIADFVSKVNPKTRLRTRDDMMAAFGEKAFLMLKTGSRLSGVAGLQVENLVARTDDVYLDPRVPLAGGMQAILTEVERSSRELQCEVSLLFLPPSLARHESVWQELGYELRTVNSLGVSAWQEAAQESMPHGTVLLFKQLRKDRVLRPV
jgi:dephospho-CoA kinase